MNTNYNNQIDGVLELINVHGTLYQLGSDASNTKGGITKLFNSFETYNDSVDGTYNAKTVYNEISAIKNLIGIGSGDSIADQVSDLKDKIGNNFNSSNTVQKAIAAAKTTIAVATGENYLSLTEQTDSVDNHKKYTISTTGIDQAIGAAIQTALGNMPDVVDTIQTITQWISEQPDTVSIVQSIGGKISKISNGVEGDIPTISSDGSIIDSGYRPTDFQPYGNYKVVQTAVSDPTASGNATAFISSISQNENGEITASKKNIQLADASHDGLISSADFNKLSGLISYSAGTGINITAGGQISVDTSALPQPNSTPSYADVQYSVESSTGTNSIVIDGSKPIHVITLTNNSATVTVGTQPAEGHSTHVFFCSDASRNITIQHNASTTVCPDATDIVLTVSAGGFVEVDFLRANNRLYVRAV